jgi:hypothetical protein
MEIFQWFLVSAAFETKLILIENISVFALRIFICPYKEVSLDVRERCLFSKIKYHCNWITTTNSSHLRESL